MPSSGITNIWRLINQNLVCLLQFTWQCETSNEQTGIQPTFHARAEEEAEGMPPLDAGLSRSADQKTPGVCPRIQRSV